MLPVKLSINVLLKCFSVSSYEKNQAYMASTEWSDEDQTAPDSGNDTNGGANPFEEDVVKGVRVRALYDYDGQEQDELSFRAGEGPVLHRKMNLENSESLQLKLAKIFKRT